ncbi:MAG TPA: hypothetical protein VFI56_20280 [Vicinamibacterales bacterium]|nr:hypothetical protein [Vicinamibacterales bacterium]
MTDEKSVHRTLDASTAHVPPDERDYMMGVFSVNEYDEGFWLWVSPEDSLPEGSEEFPAVLALLDYARGLNCRWVNLDRDGDLLEGLPAYEEEPCEAEDCPNYPLWGENFCEEHNDAEAHDVLLAEQGVISPGPEPVKE